MQYQLFQAMRSIPLHKFSTVISARHSISQATLLVAIGAAMLALGVAVGCAERQVPVTVQVPATVQVEVTREVQVPVEVTREVEVTRAVEVTREVAMPVTVQVPIEVTREVEITTEVPVTRVIEVTKEVPATVEVTREVVMPVTVQVPIEVTREVVVPVPLEVTREVEVAVTTEVPVTRVVEVTREVPATVEVTRVVEAELDFSPRDVEDVIFTHYDSNGDEFVVIGEICAKDHEVGLSNEAQLWMFYIRQTTAESDYDWYVSTYYMSNKEICDLVSLYDETSQSRFD